MESAALGLRSEIHLHVSRKDRLAVILDLPLSRVVEDPADAFDVVRRLFLAIHDLGSELPGPRKLLQFCLVVLAIGNNKQSQHEQRLHQNSPRDWT